MKLSLQHIALRSVCLCLLLNLQVSGADEPIVAKTTVAPTVTVDTARKTKLIDRVSVSGTLVAGEEVYVNTRINGYAIEKINVDIGDQVKSGDVLAVLDGMNLKSQVLQAEAELSRSMAAIAQAQSQVNEAKATRKESILSLNRSQRLRRSGVISQEELDKAVSSSDSSEANLMSAESGLDVARAQSNQAKLQLELAQLNQAREKIRAPVDGIISARTARLGAIASSGGEPLFRMIENGVVEMEAEVIETALSAIIVGNSAEMEIAGLKPMTGRVRLISPTVDDRTRLAKVRIRFPAATRLRPGLSAHGWSLVSERNVTTVPISAITTKDNQEYVSLVIDGVVEKRQVTAGAVSDDGRREIISGLNDGDVVIAKAGAFFSDGDKVTAQ
jgi:HlyD family secretion protein